MLSTTICSPQGSHRESGQRKADSIMANLETSVASAASVADYRNSNENIPMVSIEKRPAESDSKSTNARAGAADGIAKKRRKKAIKSCAFCRKRKLRCDQQRPRCSTCVARGLTECVYGTEAESISEDKSGTNSVPRNKQKQSAEIDVEVEEGKSSTQLLEKLDELQKQLEDGGAFETGAGSVGGSSVTDSVTEAGNTSTSPVHRSAWINKTTSYVMVQEPAGTKSQPANVLRDQFTLQCKKSGRRILYGPTSTRIFLANSGWGLLQRFRQLWGKVKAARVQWKKDTHFTMLREVKALEALPSNPSCSLLLEEVCSALPSYEKIKSIIDLFFSNNVIFEVNTILDQQKVKKDFEFAFSPGPPSSKLGGERPIVSLIPSEKKNYYRVGVIIEILVMAHFREEVPAPIEKFLVYFSGLTTGKVLFIERTQMFMLRYHYRLKFSFTGGDGSHTMILVDEMIASAIYLGLNHNIKSLYKGQEEDVGKLESLENLWLWILFADCDTSLQIGRMLRVSDDDIGDEELFEDNDPGFYGLMKRFVKMVRKMLQEIHNKKRSPELKMHCETLIEFVEVEFPSLSLYTSRGLISQVDMGKIRILSQTLSLLISFYSLRYAAYKELSVGLKNGVMKATLIAFSLHINLTLYCFELDKKHFPELVKPGYRSLPPYMCHSLSLVYGLPFRAITVFYSIAYTSLTLFESGLLCIMKKKQTTTQCELDSLRVQDEMFISFVTYFKHFLEIFDGLVSLKNTQLLSVIKRSHAFVIEMAFEKICRTVIEKVIECRSNAESNWMDELQNVQPNLLISDFETPWKLIHSGAGTISYIPATSDIESNVANNIENTNDCTAEFSPLRDNNLQTQQLPSSVAPKEQEELTQTITEEFWQNYSISWQEILDSADTDNFFQELML